MPATQQQFAYAFSRGVQAADALRDELSPPVRDTVDVMIAAVEQATGKPLGQWVAEQSAELVNEIVNDLAEGVDIPDVGGVADVVPMITGAVSAMMGAWGAASAQLASMAQRRTEEQAQDCYRSYRRTTAETVGTGPGGSMTPADLFRPLAQQVERNDLTEASLGRGGHQVLGVSALFACLCGPEARGWGWKPTMITVWTPSTEDVCELEDLEITPATLGSGRTYQQFPGGRTGYGQWLGYARQVLKDSRLGIPTSVQRQMWLIIEAIMAASRPHELARGSVQAVGDQGRTLFSTLLDIVLTQYEKGRWNQGFLRGLQNSQLSCYRIIDYCKTATNIEPVVDLSADFKALIAQWKRELYPVSQSDYLAVARQQAAQRSTLKTFHFSPQIAAKLASSVALTRESAKLGVKIARAEQNKKAAIATTGVVFLAGAVWAWRRRAR